MQFVQSYGDAIGDNDDSGHVGDDAEHDEEEDGDDDGDNDDVDDDDDGDDDTNEIAFKVNDIFCPCCYK